MCVRNKRLLLNQSSTIVSFPMKTDPASVDRIMYPIISKKQICNKQMPTNLRLCIWNATWRYMVLIC